MVFQIMSIVNGPRIPDTKVLLEARISHLLIFRWAPDPRNGCLKTVHELHCLTLHRKDEGSHVHVYFQSLEPCVGTKSTRPQIKSSGSWATLMLSIRLLESPCPLVRPSVRSSVRDKICRIIHTCSIDKYQGSQMYASYTNASSTYA